MPAKQAARWMARASPFSPALPLDYSNATVAL